MSLCALSMLIAGAAAQAQATYTVTRFDDTSVGTLEAGGGFGPGVSGDLRYALFQAMANGGATTINFSCGAPPCKITLAAPLPPIFETSNPSNFNLTIDGGTEGSIVLDGASLYRVFFVDNVAVTLKNLVIQNALAKGGAGGPGAGGGAGFGAGLFVNQATAAVVLQNMSFLNCTAIGGAGGLGFNIGGGGGLVYAGGLGNSTAADGGGGGVSGPGASTGNGIGGSAYAANGAGATGSAGGGNGGAGGGGGGVYISVQAFGGAGGFGGGGGGAYSSASTATGGAGGFGGGGGGFGNSGFGAGGGVGGFGGGGGINAAGGGGVGGITGGSGAYAGGAGYAGGGGAAAGPAIFVVSGSVTLYNVTGSGFTATGGQAQNNNATAGTADSTAVFNYGGTVNGDSSGGPIANAVPAAQPVGQTSTTQAQTVTLTTAVPAGTVLTTSVLTQGTAGLDYNLVSGGTCSSGLAFQAGDTCTVLYNSTPTAPGLVQGAITVTSTSAVTAANPTGLLATTPLSSVATGPAASFPSNSAPQALVNSLTTPAGMAVDAGGNVYVGSNSSSNVSITKIPPGCKTPACRKSLGTGFSKLTGLAVDGRGAIYAADSGNSAVKLVEPGCTSASCITALGGGFVKPAGLAVDGAGSVYVADSSTAHPGLYRMLTSCRTSGCVTKVNGNVQPAGVALDGLGNAYVADLADGGIKKIGPGCKTLSCIVKLGGSFKVANAAVRVPDGGVRLARGAGRRAGGVVRVAYSPGRKTAGWTNPTSLAALGEGDSFDNGSGVDAIGVAVDASGSVYVTDEEGSAVQMIPAACVSSGCVTPLGSGYSSPIGVALDRSGNVYVADSGNSAVQMLPLATPPTVVFATPTADGTTDTADGTQTGTVQNIGNEPLTFAIPGSGTTNPTTPPDFTFTPTGSTACPLLTNSASTTATLAAGASCTLPLTFTPVAPANHALTESLTFTESDPNLGTLTQSITLQGTAYVPLTLLPAAGALPNASYGVTYNQAFLAGGGAGGYTFSSTGSLPPGLSLNSATGVLSGTPTAAADGNSYTFNVIVTDSASQNFSQQYTLAVPQVLESATLTLSSASSPTSSSSVTVPAGAAVTATVTLTDTAGLPFPIPSYVSLFTGYGHPTEVIGATVIGGGTLTETISDTTPETLTLSISGLGVQISSMTATATFVAPAYLVTVATDPATGNGTPGNCIATGLTGDNSNCSLRDAVAAANALSGVTTKISFDPALMAGATTANPVTIQIAQSTPITISQSVNLMGPGANLLTVEGGTTPLSATNHAVFQQTGGNVTFSGMTVANGYGTANNGNGGAISAYGSGTLTVSNSTFSGNYAYSAGGAIYAQGALTVSNSTFSTNQAANGSGGAIAAQGTVTVSDSTFSGNQAGNGNGGAILANSTVTVSNSTFSGNQATFDGGAIYESNGTTTSNAVVINSIFTGNSAQYGGAAYVIAVGTQSTAALTSLNSIFYANIASTSGNDCYASSAACNFVGEIIANPNLNPLGYYGGPTQTLLPLPGSSAICAGFFPTLNGNALTTDQRGVTISGSRYGPNACYDVGAVQTEYALNFTLQPSNVAANSIMRPFPVTALTENSSNTIYARNSATDADGSLTGSPVSSSLSGDLPNLVFTTPATADTLTATLVLNGPITLSAVSGTFNVTPDPISTFNSKLIASPTTAVAGRSVTLTATWIDANGNPIPGVQVVFSQTGPPSTTAIFSPANGTSVTDIHGIATLTLTDTVAESLIFSAYSPNGNLANAATVQFVAPAYIVTVNTDEASGNGVASNCVDPNISTSGNGNCSLRDAVAAANALSGVTTKISFDPALTASATTANPGTIQIAQPTPITISQSVNLMGPAANLLALEGGTTPLTMSNNQILKINNGNVSVSGLTLANGSSGDIGGGAIEDSGSGTLTVTNSSFSGNFAFADDPGSGSGGAISAKNATLTVSNSSFSGNYGRGAGGAIYTRANGLTVSNSTFSGNQGTSGGAISTNATLALSNSTFSGNSAGYYGGAVLVNDQLTVSNSIFSGDSASNGSGIYASNGGTATNIVYYGDNISGVTPTNSINADPKLSPLGFYGGPTPTLLPLPGSAAICAGTVPMLNGNAIATDQRGDMIMGTRYGQNTCYDAGAVQTAYALAFGPNPAASSLVTLGSAVTPAPYATVTESGSPLTAGPATVTMTDADSDFANGATLTATTSTSNGQGSFGNLLFNGPQGSDTLIAILTLNLNLTTAVSLSAASNSFQVGQLPQTITNFNPPMNVVYGQTPITLSATGGASGNPVTFRVFGAGPGIITGNQLTITGAGVITVEADQAGNTTYSASTPVIANIVVAPKGLTVSVVGNPTKVYDGTYTATLTPANYQVGGLVGNDAITINRTSGVYTQIDASTMPIPLSVFLASSNFTATSGYLTNYSLPSNAFGTGSITPAPLTATAGSYMGVYDGSSHALSACVTSANPDNLACTNNPAGPVGPDVGGTTVTPVIGSPTGHYSPTNYTVTNNPGAWSITPRSVTLTAGSYTGTYDGLGHAPSPCTSNYAGVSCSNVPVYQGPSVKSVSVTPIPSYITGNASDYTVTYNPGTLTITKLAASVTPNPATKVFGTTDPTLTGSLSGFLAADGVTVTYARTAGESVGGSPYTISATLNPTGVLTNYAITYNTAGFTITQATPTVTWANPPSIVYGTLTGAAQKTATATGVGGVSLPGAYFYTTPDGTLFTVGTHPLGLAFTPTDITDYIPVSAYAYLTVTKATPTVTWAAPAAITYGTALSSTQLNATSPVQGSFSYNPAAGTVLRTGSGQTLSVTFTPTDTNDYNPVTTMVPLTVNKATPIITWPTPASITYGTALSATQLNATASTAGTFSYTPSSGVLAAGSQPLSVLFTPTDTTDYNSNSAGVTLTITKATTTTTLAVTTTQTVTGTTATITATVHPQIGGTPTGTVTYYNGSTALGSAAVGTPFTTAVLPVGTDQLTAVYSGDKNFTGSSSSATAVTSIAPTTVQLTSSLGTVFYPASAVGFTVIVPLKNFQLISGTITIYDGSTVIGTYTLPAGGVLAGFTPQLSVGTHTLRAVYSGNAQYPPGQSTIVTVTVSPL